MHGTDVSAASARHWPRRRSRHLLAPRHILALLGIFATLGLLALTALPAQSQTVRPLRGRADGTVADWPLRFSHHMFNAACFDMQGCFVRYNGHDFDLDQPMPPASSFAPDVYDNVIMQAGYGPVSLKEPPAKARWRSKDGTALQADIDINAIFKDRLIRHNVPKDDIQEDVSMGSTRIIVEIDDRTINVYTRTMIFTKELQTPGNKYSGFRDDLIKVYSRTY